MSLFKKYAKQDFLELRPVVELDIEQFWDNSGKIYDGHNNVVHIPKELRLKGSPKIGDYIARDEKNPSFAWLIDNETFKNNFKELAGQ